MLFSINSLVFVFEFRPRSTPFVFILFPSNKYSSFLLTCTSAHFLTNTPSGSLNPTFDAQILQTKRKLSFLLLSNAICIKNNHLRMPFYKVVSGRSKILKPRPLSARPPWRSLPRPALVNKPIHTKTLFSLRCPWGAGPRSQCSLLLASGLTRQILRILARASQVIKPLVRCCIGIWACRNRVREVRPQGKDPFHRRRAMRCRCVRFKRRGRSQGRRKSLKYGTVIEKLQEKR